jgi:hypothetical protein
MFSDGHYTRNVGECVKMAMSAIMQYEWRMEDEERAKERMLYLGQMKSSIDEDVARQPDEIWP